MTKLTRIQTPTESYERFYPRIVELANIQLEKQLWFSSEMKVELDRIQLKYDLEPDQRHAVEGILNLFVYYERKVGDMWSRIKEIFPRPEVELACSVVEMTERAIHAEFYNQINVQLGLDKEENYLAYLDDPLLNERASWLGKLMKSDDEILGVIIFSMTETALLFSMFAMLKSFQSSGYNMVPVVVRGTNQSAIDEDLHGQITAEIINTYYSELDSTLLEDTERYGKVKEAVHYAYEHECRIVDLMIPGKSLNGKTKEQYKEFVKTRLNIYLERLGLPHEFVVHDDSIGEWFGKNTYAYKVPDFFTKGVPMEYELAWDESLFTAAWDKNWKPEGI